HTSSSRDWSSDVCSSDLGAGGREISDGVTQVSNRRLQAILNSAQITPQVVDGLQRLTQLVKWIVSNRSAEIGELNLAEVNSKIRSEESRVGTERRAGSRQ